MDINKLDKRITMLKPIKTDNGKGGQIITYAAGGQLWAEIRKPKFSTVDIAGVVVSDMTGEINIRHKVGIVKGWRVSYGPRTYSVEHVYDLDNETTVLVCRELVL